MSLLQALLSGALNGSFFALIALGVSLSWGYLKVLNLAHFGSVLLGAYLTYQISTSTGMSPLLTIFITAPILFVFGGLIQLGYARFQVSELSSLLISYGILIITIQVITNVWTADFRRLTDNPYATGAIEVGPLIFRIPTVLAAATGVVMIFLAGWVLDRTYAGRALRAFGQDRQIASAFGIDHRLLGVVLAGAAGATAAVAGMLFTLSRDLSPDIALEWIGMVFAIVILGGIGNVAGTLFAGMLVGAVTALVSVVWTPSTAPFAVFSLVVLALLFRPTGLFKQKAGGHH